MKTVRIVENFLSLQGESTHAGRLCWFIRLAGCNLRCSYCDTLPALSFDAGEETPLDAVVARAAASGSPLVEVTGGEPLAVPDTPKLCRMLLDAGLEVLLETNGSLPIDPVPAEVRKILDCKLPDSGMSEHNRYENYALLLPHDEIKFVVGSRRDFDFARDVIEQYRLPEKTGNLLISPVWGRVAFDQLAQWVIDSRLPVRMQLQLHKLIWGDRPGV